MEFFHGDLFQYEMANKDKELKTALIVSGDSRGRDDVLSIIILTNEPKSNISVPITTNQGIMYADCGMISFALAYRFGVFLQSVKQKEMEKVDEGILNALGLENRVIEKEVVKEVEVVKEIPVETTSANTSKELIQAKAEANVYKNLYENLLAKVME